MKAHQPRTIQDLRHLLVTLGPFPGPVVERAEQALLAAVDDYLLSRPLVGSTGAQSALPIKLARDGFAKLTSRLRDAQAAVSALPPNALSALDQTCRPAMGSLQVRLARLIGTVERAKAVLDQAKDKPADAARAALAREVALVTRDILRLRPARSRLTKFTGTSKPRTAAYARLLQATFAVAGLPSTDLGRWIDAGLDLLDDPALPPSRER